MSRTGEISLSGQFNLSTLTTSLSHLPIWKSGFRLNQEYFKLSSILISTLQLLMFFKRNSVSTKTLSNQVLLIHFNKFKDALSTP